MPADHPKLDADAARAMAHADERLAEIKAEAIAQAKRNIERGRGTVMKIDASDIAYPDSVAILSVWGQVKDGGTWAAPGPPPWVINKIASDRGTLVTGVLDERTSAAFSAAGITIGDPADAPPTAHTLLDKVADVMGVEVSGALREFLHSQEMAIARLAEEVERLKAQHAKSYTDSANSAFAGGMEQAADVVSAWPIAARLIRAAARAEVKRG